MNLSFNGKGGANAVQGAAACLPAVAAYSAEAAAKAGSAKAGQPPKSKIDGWEAVVP
jgi:hypothetical protein